MNQIILKPGREAPVQRHHQWIFSGAVARTVGQPHEGDAVAVCDARGQLLATGFFQEGSICVKLLGPGALEPDAAFFHQKIRSALALRQGLHLPQTTAYRLVHGEGDGLPGLVLDYYDGVVVLQAHSVGMHRHRGAIAEALQTLLGPGLRALYDKSHETLPPAYAATMQNGYLFLQEDAPLPLPHAVLENGHRFLIDWERGQKTGFFLDQRDNRALLARYADGQRVLNAFCYSGGFSVYALAAGAAAVVSVDASAKAIALTDANVAANFPERTAVHESVTADVMAYLRQQSGQHGVVVLDPPAFAKSTEARHRAVQAYKRLNAEGLRHLAPGGLLFTFSCSQVVDTELFRNTVVAAALEAGRPVRVLHQLSQGPDHPVNLFHPEGHYLKGLVLYAE